MKQKVLFQLIEKYLVVWEEDRMNVIDRPLHVASDQWDQTCHHVFTTLI